MSDIRVSVQWKSSTVFAGEDIECTITFKNVSQAPSPHRSPSPNSELRSNSSPRKRWKETLPVRPGHSSIPAGPGKSPSISGAPQNQSRLHRQALSLSTPDGFVQAPIGVQESTAKGSRAGGNTHRRSLSIVSIGGENISQPSSQTPQPSAGRPSHGHTRAASLQVLPKRIGTGNGIPTSVPLHERAFTLPSPLFRNSSSYAEQRASLHASPRSSPLASFDTGLSTPPARKQERHSVSGFKFPQIPPSIDERAGAPTSATGKQQLGASQQMSSAKQIDFPNGFDRPNPATRILSPASINGTPRSSGEFYSMSNNSTETLASEYITQESSRLVHRPAHSRQGSYLATTKSSQPETLMMGYGQLVGSFVLDGSLVNQSSFERVKRKGLIGGQGGGGVVRNEVSKRDSGILGSFGWGNIGESLGGLLGGNELSSIRETKSNRSSKTVPIMSTPQSIIFVDLRLAPGESRSYSYKHPLPMGLPPTHKGRAIKISYNLVVGTQRAARISQQLMIKHAEVPFRVLPSVNDRGETLGHDLMTPHTILSNIASISTIDNLQQSKAAVSDVAPSGASPASTEFVNYVESLLERPQQNSGYGLLSPTEVDSRTPSFLGEAPATVKESIDIAILRSNTTTSSKQSTNRFKINRSGDHVAVILLARPAYRLGETVPVAIDFQDADVRCYALHATLESAETVDPTIALRSKASILRATKRIHASQNECTIASRKVLFQPMIPNSATPEFITSGINLEWCLRFEFVTSRSNGNEEEEEAVDELVEEVARDERGSVSAAVQGLPCETFEVTVPLHVYGATTEFDELTETTNFPV